MLLKICLMSLCRVLPWAVLKFAAATGATCIAGHFTSQIQLPPGALIPGLTTSLSHRLLSAMWTSSALQQQGLTPGQCADAELEILHMHGTVSPGLANGLWEVQQVLPKQGYVDHKVHHPVTIAKFIVLPGNELDKVVIEGNASPSIADEGVRVTVKVAGDNLVLSTAYDALEGALDPCYFLDVIIFGNFLQAAGCGN
ncbi:hypothetical protein QTO34_016098 [Cnephaeus nilssonii]|uniref:Uncharacterized protein n=1 Tax=Cnephaeus nilssonii TaxID=3371016 RepID=A0AA40LTR9_CNENI|nr:hypothetical protein QTO34_016098 [Eptesicus nilssonii]